MKQNELDVDVPVNEITRITFSGEPTGLNGARINAANGNYSSAKELLDKIDESEIERDVIKQDLEFYKALCIARLALGGAGSVQDAGRLMNGFVRSNSGSYHYLEANEVLGDLLVALGSYGTAEGFYGELAKAPWPDYKMRSGVLLGRVLQAQNKHSDAIAKFDAVLAMSSDSPEAKKQQLAATLGKAISRSETGQVEEAIKMVETVIAEAGPEEVQLHARAYNALGTCYVKADKTKDALIAFLHVDVLYKSFPEAHAEALANLAKLWVLVGKGDRARSASVMLKERYPNSRWAQQ
jgi:tetratricopeptide (TPR) repeat protein